MLGSDNLLCSQNNASYQSIPRVAYTFNTTISGIEDSDFCLLVGTNPRKEAAILNTRIRKRYLQGNFEISLTSSILNRFQPNFTGCSAVVNFLGGILIMLVFSIFSVQKP